MKKLFSFLVLLILAVVLSGSGWQLRRFQGEDQDNRLLDSEAVDAPTSGAGETSIYTFSVTGGLLGTANKLRLVLIGDMDGGTNETNFRLKYGATTLINLAATPGNDPTPVILTAELVGDAATGLQVGSVTVFYDDSNSDGANGTAAEDSTGTLTLELTAETNNASQTYTMRHATLQLLTEP